MSSNTNPSAPIQGIGKPAIAYPPAARIAFNDNGVELTLISQEHGSYCFDIDYPNVLPFLYSLKGGLRPPEVPSEDGRLIFNGSGPVVFSHYVFGSGDSKEPTAFSIVGHLTPEVRVRLIDELEAHLQTKGFGPELAGVRKGGAL